MADCENLKDSDSDISYGTFLGMKYCKGTGAVRLLYCTLIALVLSLIRVIADLALGFAIVHSSSWYFLMASLVDLLTAVTTAVAGWFAVKQRRHGIVVFSVICFLETALYSAAYLLLVLIVTWWQLCDSDLSRFWLTFSSVQFDILVVSKFRIILEEPEGGAKFDASTDGGQELGAAGSSASAVPDALFDVYGEDDEDEVVPPDPGGVETTEKLVGD
eukprot:Skav218492  [mRNA]  locus=scaffold538:1339859:1343630:- [translate_table: standard]